MTHPEVAYYQCQVCGGVLSEPEVHSGRCLECSALNSAIAIFVPEEDEC